MEEITADAVKQQENQNQKTKDMTDKNLVDEGLLFMDEQRKWIS